MNRLPKNNTVSAHPDEMQLVRRAKAGDEDALTGLIGRYAPLVRLRAASFHGGLDLDDLYQEGMIALLKAVRYYREDASGSFKTFALVCINNKLRSAYTAHMREKNAPLRDYLSLSDTPEDLQHLLPASSDHDDPQTLLIANEQADARRRQINVLLSPFERQVLRFYLSSYSYEEMASQLGSSAKAVDNALQRVRRKLRTVFTSE